MQTYFYRSANCISHFGSSYHLHPNAVVEIKPNLMMKRMKQSELSQFLKVYGKIGLMSFGGPAGQIALMHRVIVQEKMWLNEKEYLNALSFCMFLPGPEAMQLATYSGWRLRGVTGVLISGLLFVLPGTAVVLGLAIIYSLYGSTPTLSALFLGIKAAVVLIVLEALDKVARKSLKIKASWVIVGLFFCFIFLEFTFSAHHISCCACWIYKPR